MERLPHNVADCIKEAMAEVEALMRAAFAEVGGVAPTGSALDQCGLRNGRDIVIEYLNIGEPGLALEHLIYMVHEPELLISPRTYAYIESAGTAMRMDKHLWQQIRPAGGAANG